MVDNLHSMCTDSYKSLLPEKLSIQKAQTHNAEYLKECLSVFVSTEWLTREGHESTGKGLSIVV